MKLTVDLADPSDVAEAYVLLSEAYVLLSDRVGTPAQAPAAPPQTLIVPNSALPLPLRRFAAPGEVSAVAASPASPDALRLTYPPDGAEIDADGPLIAKARGGRGPWTFLLNGTPIAIAQPQPVASLPHPGAGFARLTVVDANGASATAAIRLH